jgi:hypothetical protein
VGKGDRNYTYLMTTPQAKTVERESLPPVILLTTVVEYKPNCSRKSASKKDCNERGRRETYGIGDKVIEEPRGGDGEESDPVALEDQPVGDLGVLHGVTLEPFGLLHL